MSDRCWEEKTEEDNEKKKALLLDSEVRKSGRLSDGGLSELYWLGAERIEIGAFSVRSETSGETCSEQRKQLHPERYQMDHMVSLMLVFCEAALLISTVLTNLHFHLRLLSPNSPS